MSPRKPEKKTGVISFSKDGSVSKDVDDWPRDQAGQELKIGELFAATLLERHGRRLDCIRRLPENDHDLEAIEDGQRVQIQVAELVTTEVAGGPMRSHGDAWLFYEGELDDLLLRAIQRKIEKYPEQDSRLILLVYCVDPAPPEFVEHVVAQRQVVPTPLVRAREYLSEHGAKPFDEVWIATPIAGSAQISAVFPMSETATSDGSTSAR